MRYCPPVYNKNSHLSLLETISATNRRLEAPGCLSLMSRWPLIWTNIQNIPISGRRQDEHTPPVTGVQRWLKTGIQRKKSRPLHQAMSRTFHGCGNSLQGSRLRDMINVKDVLHFRAGDFQ